MPTPLFLRSGTWDLWWSTCPLCSAACWRPPSPDPYLQAIGSRQCKAQWLPRASESEARWKLQKQFPGGALPLAQICRSFPCASS